VAVAAVIAKAEAVREEGHAVRVAGVKAVADLVATAGSVVTGGAVRKDRPRSI
jgi:hypothetical protein